MHPTDRPAAAPLNTEPRWPAGYVDALRRAGAQEKAIPFCVGWVQRFFAENPGRRRRDLGRTEIEAFLSRLLARPGLTNWHIQQARDSLEMYYEQFRGIALDPRPDVPVPHGFSPGSTEPSTTAGPPPALRVATEEATIVSARHYSEARSAVNGEIRKTGDFHPGEKGRRIPAKAGATNGRADGVEPVRPAGARACNTADGVEPVPPKTGKVNWSALADKIKECLRVEHYSYRTEQSYLAWIRRYVMFHGWRKPSTLEAVDVHVFLRHLAMDQQVASSTQNQALNAVVFL